MPINKIKVSVKVEKEAEGLPLPHFQTDGSVGLDLYAAVDEPVQIPIGQGKLISTGLRLSIPLGYEAQVRPRSGLALKHGIGVLNSPGTIDSDYRGIVGIILFNFGSEPFVVNKGDRIAQMVFNKIEHPEFEVVHEIDQTDRGDGGFGHTGI